MSDQIYNFILELTESLVVLAISTIVAMLFTKKYWPMLSFAIKMKKYGFESVNTNKLTKRELRNIFTKAERVRIMYVSGYTFFMNEFIQGLLTDSEGKDIIIQLLCSGDETDFLRDIERLEQSYGKRGKESSISLEIKAVGDFCKNLQNIEIRNFSTEYRMPFILADYKFNSETEEYMKTKAWLYITFPPYKSNNSIILRGCNKENEDSATDQFNLIYMLDEHFESIWKKH